MRTGERPSLHQAGWLVAAAVAVVATAQWRARLQEAERRAGEAERTRDEVARRRAMEERLRIARDLHDSLTHSISVIKVQAGVEAHLARKNGETPSAAVLAIQEASSDAVRELRSTLEVLRRSDASDGSGLDRLPALVDRACASGVSATLAVHGTSRPLPPELERTAYRVVQEALTNVVRHAGRATASVSVTFRSDALVVRVEDDGDGPRAQPATNGFGLIGMRERVTGIGGQLRTGPRQPRGFSVYAELPMDGTL